NELRVRLWAGGALDHEFGRDSGLWPRGAPPRARRISGPGPRGTVRARLSPAYVRRAHARFGIPPHRAAGAVVPVRKRYRRRKRGAVLFSRYGAFPAIRGPRPQRDDRRPRPGHGTRTF